MGVSIVILGVVASVLTICSSWRELQVNKILGALIS